MTIKETKIFENWNKDSNIGANSESGVRNVLHDIAIFKNMRIKKLFVEVHSEAMHLNVDGCRK